MKQVVSMEKMEESDYVPDVPPKLHHDADYVIRTWYDHKLHHTYPETGAYNDQDAFLMLDWHAMNMYYGRVWKGEFVGSNMPLPSEGEDWLSMTGG